MLWKELLFSMIEGGLVGYCYKRFCQVIIQVSYSTIKYFFYFIPPLLMSHHGSLEFSCRRSSLCRAPLSSQICHPFCIFLLDPLNCLVPVILHHSLLLEVFHLQSVSHKPLYQKPRVDPVQHTQAFAQAPSNSAISLPHFLLASLSSFIASRISFWSKQAKKRSRPSQHRSREDRSGAMRPPSEDLEESEDHENQPMLRSMFLLFNVELGRIRESLLRV